MNGFIGSFSSKIVVGINSEGELGLFAKTDIDKGSVVLTSTDLTALPSFKEYYRTYFFVEMAG